jgi:hypothetical protein
MGKRSRTKVREAPADSSGIGPRQPCPCGSGRRYKACHGAAGGPGVLRVHRPFAGLPGECDLVAMREFVPAATAPVRLAGTLAEEHPETAVQVCSLLPMAAPALVRADGGVWLGLQVQHAYGDPSRELAAVLLDALAAEPGSMVGLAAAPGEGPRLQDVLVDEPLQVTVHRGFDFWLADVDDPDGSVAAALEQANAAAAPTARLTSVEAAYWTEAGAKEHLRWVLPDDEDRALDALARVHAAGADGLVEGDRLIGMFRAHGLLVPVWDLPAGTGPEALEEPAERVAGRLADALAETAPLSAHERSVRAGLTDRQVTLR